MMRLLANPLATYMSAMAGLLLLVGLALLLSRVRLAFGERAQGQVTGYSERIQARRGAKRQYMPIVRFHARNGSMVEFQSRMGGSVKGFQAGEPVPVVYRPNRPEVAEIASFPRLWLAPAVILIMALISFGGAWKAGTPH